MTANDGQSGESATFEELVYADQEAIDWFRERWPQATFQDASDFIHTERFAVAIPDVTEDEAYPAIIAEGFALVCLGLGIMLYQPERKADVERWLAEAKTLVATANGRSTDG